MVAISLYKGNLHKVPDVPRRWPVPTPNISLKDFKILLRRRARALARLRSSAAEADINVATISSPSPGRSPRPEPNHANTDSIIVDNYVNDSNGDNHPDNHCSEPDLLSKGDLEVRKGGKEEVREMMMEDKEGSLKKMMEKTDAMVEEQKNKEIVKDDEKLEAIVKLEGEKSDSENATSDAEKRLKEVKQKLEILNEKKHNLVQLLKQILNAEEQLKRQNSPQGMSSRPPLLVDTSTDSGSMTKVNTPRIGPDGIPCVDVEGGEPDDASNHNMTSRLLPRMSSTSPSSDSQHRKPNPTMVPHSYRATMGIAGSPSRFAPAAQSQGQGQVHSTLSVSATSYVVSSPSPAASGDTSIFRDTRLPSPWN